MQTSTVCYGEQCYTDINKGHRDVIVLSHTCFSVSLCCMQASQTSEKNELFLDFIRVVCIGHPGDFVPF